MDEQAQGATPARSRRPSVLSFLTCLTSHPPSLEPRVLSSLSAAPLFFPS